MQSAHRLICELKEMRFDGILNLYICVYFRGLPLKKE